MKEKDLVFASLITALILALNWIFTWCFPLFSDWYELRTQVKVSELYMFTLVIGLLNTLQLVVFVIVWLRAFNLIKSES